MVLILDSMSSCCNEPVLFLDWKKTLNRLAVCYSVVNLWVNWKCIVKYYNYQYSYEFTIPFFKSSYLVLQKNVWKSSFNFRFTIFVDAQICLIKRQLMISSEMFVSKHDMDRSNSRKNEFSSESLLCFQFIKRTTVFWSVNKYGWLNLWVDL